MSQMKHFAVYNGQNQNLNTDISDQPLHENYLLPYEGGFVDGKAAATMCSYQILRDTSTHLPATVSSLTPAEPVPGGPDTGDVAAERVALRVRAAAAARLRAARPVALAGVRRLRLPGDALDLRDPPGRGPGDADADRLLQRSTRANAGSRPTRPAARALMGTGRRPGEGRLLGCRARCTPAASPGPDCPANGCTLVDAVVNGTIAAGRLQPVAGPDPLPGAALRPARLRPDAGLDAVHQPGWHRLRPHRHRSAARRLELRRAGARHQERRRGVVEKMCEEGATLLKNAGSALPLDRASTTATSSSPAPTPTTPSPTRPTRPRRA